MNKKQKEKVVLSIKEALKKVLSGVVQAKEQHLSFTEAVIDSLDDKAKAILEKYTEKKGKAATERFIAESIGEANSDGILNKILGEVLGIGTEELKEAALYAAKRNNYYTLLAQLSELTKINKTDLILSFDYSTGLDDRIAKLETLLGEIVKDNVEV